jgi:DNA-binding LacI/PurR family transcriptional regulator
MPKRTVTMKDVARKASVNQSTVSRVLGPTGGASISAVVRARIQRIARSLDYHPNPNAVALRTGATRTVMVVVSDMTDMYYSGIISGVQEVLVAEGYNLVLHSLAHAGPPADMPRFLQRYHFDGVLMLGALPGLTDDLIAGLGGRELPLVLVGRALKARTLPSVTAANRDGGRLAAAHLWELGHRRIAVMRGPREWPDMTSRVEGFRAELVKRGARPEVLHLFPCASRRSHSGREATESLLKSWKPTAIFCMNDATAVGCLSALRRAGRHVPVDVSVVGFDDGELAEFSCPPLTSVRQPRHQMGREGARRLVSAIRGQSAESLVLGVDLVVRESTCPPL